MGCFWIIVALIVLVSFENQIDRTQHQQGLPGLEKEPEMNSVEDRHKIREWIRFRAARRTTPKNWHRQSSSSLIRVLPGG